jgi:DNA polymerase-1
MKTIVDGNNILHSSFHVVKFRATTPDQFIKEFLKRFASMKREHPDLILVFDGKNNTEKQSKELDTYKADRGNLTKEAARIFSATRTLLRFTGYRVIHEHGVEADQVIATLALNAAEAGEDVLIISNDKDFNQLINDKIKVYDPRNKEFRDKKFVVKKFGVTPAQFAFYLTLNGDKIDGVAGLEGCGPVNTVKLIKKFGTFKNAVATLSDCSFELPRYEKMFVEQMAHLKSCYKVVKLTKLKKDFKVSTGKKNMYSFSLVTCAGVASSRE